MQVNPYDNAAQCAKHIGIDKSIVCSVLKDDFHMHKINFKWIPYELSEIREKRMEIANNLLYFFSKSSRIEQSIDTR